MQPKRSRRRTMEANLDRWLGGAPRIECDWEPLKRTYGRSLVDLAALRFAPPVAGGRSLPAAGLPWFMTNWVVQKRAANGTKKQLKKESKLVRAESMKVLAEFEMLYKKKSENNF